MLKTLNKPVTRCPQYENYLSLIQQYAESKSLHEGRHIHEQILNSKYANNTILMNFLIMMYGNCGAVRDARKTFQSIETRNVFSWNMMVTAYAQNGHLASGKSLLERMPSQTILSCNVLISACVHNEDTDSARKIFETIPEPDVVTWTALISGYTREGHHRKSVQLFQRMCLVGTKPDRVAFISILEACDNPRSLKSVHQTILESGLVFELQLGSSLVTMYGRTYNVRSAKLVFDQMPRKNIVSWNALITAYAQNGHLLNAKELFEKMPERDVISWTALFAELARNSDLEEAREMFDKIPEPNTVSWSAMIAGYAQNGQGDEALELFRAMDSEGVCMSHATFVSTLDACTSSSTPKLGYIVIEEFLNSDIRIDVKIQTAMINLYSRLGKVDLARRVFEEVTETNYICWNSIIGAYALNGHTKESMEYLYLMSLDGFDANEVTFRMLFGVLSHTGCLQTSIDMFCSTIQDYSVRPLLDHYICITDLLGRLGRLGEAKELLMGMPFHPDAVAWTSFLSACSVQHEVCLGEYAAKQILELEAEKDSPYVVLSQLYLSQKED